MICFYQPKKYKYGYFDFIKNIIHIYVRFIFLFTKYIFIILIYNKKKIINCKNIFVSFILHGSQNIK